MPLSRQNAKAAFTKVTRAKAALASQAMNTEQIGAALVPPRVELLCDQQRDLPE